MSHDPHFPAGAVALMPEGSDGASVLAEFCREFAVSEAAAAEMLAWLDAHRPASAVDLERIRAVDARYRSAFGLLMSYQLRQQAVREVQMSTACLAHLLGACGAAGPKNEVDLGKRYGLPKQTVNKCSDWFRQALDMPLRETQRAPEARRNMRAARFEKLKTINERTHHDTGYTEPDRRRGDEPGANHPGTREDRSRPDARGPARAQSQDPGGTPPRHGRGA